MQPEWLRHEVAVLGLGRSGVAVATLLARSGNLVYASDAARTPELYLLAATWWRDALAEVLVESLPPGDAEEAGRMILRENALTLYRL